MKQVLLYILTTLSLAAFAQENNVILRAMQDELKRSTSELQYENHEKPFYISYTINDTKAFSVYGTLGGLWGSREMKFRTNNVRILVGDYEFNDESLDNNNYSEPSAHEIQVPLEDDYFGIRRSLWTTTDIVYKGAAQKYKKHQATLKEKSKPLSDIPHRTFAQLPAYQVREPIPTYQIDTKKWNDYTKELSSYFREVDALENSSVFFSFTHTVRYFVNSEGTTAIVPETIASFQCSGQVKSKTNTPVNVQTTRYAKTLDELPSFAELQRDVREAVNKLKNAQETKSLEEEYIGPVLFIGEPVVQVFTQTVLSLNASNTLQGQDGYNGEFGPAADNKIGKNYVDPAITVKALPGLKEFQGKPVLGNIVMDGEGVKPKEETILIEKGILRNLMNDRTLTKPDQVANGFSDGPGVIQVSLANGVSLTTLKSQLIAQAKAEGLEFAIILKGKAWPMGQTDILKVDVATGKEEQLSPAALRSIQPKHLKRLAGTTSQSMHYVPVSRRNPISAIVPEAILLLEVEISPFKNSFIKDDPEYITSPLKSESR